MSTGTHAMSPAVTVPLSLRMLLFSAWFILQWIEHTLCPGLTAQAYGIRRARRTRSDQTHLGHLFNWMDLRQLRTVAQEKLSCAGRV